jgi:hypothetical protein
MENINTWEKKFTVDFIEKLTFSQLKLVSLRSFTK